MCVKGNNLGIDGQRLEGSDPRSRRSDENIGIAEDGANRAHKKPWKIIAGSPKVTRGS